jgi:NAD(P)-dependent dehydrogenase (short-subunit alcohol dehydrogenase family)
MTTWRDEVALVTGGSSGIGRATAQAFADQGARVVVSDVSVEAGQQAARAITDAGGEAVFMAADVAQAGEVAALFERIQGTFGRLDFAFNNAGVAGKMMPTAELSEQAWDRIFAINLRGAWHCMKHELKLMTQRQQGVIVNCASIAGLVGFAGSAAYTASKHGLVGLTRATALEYAPLGIRINAVCPGVIHTPMVDEVIKDNPSLEDQLAQGAPIGRMGRPEEIAGLVTWLCSDAASFMIGQAVAVDGGWTAR